MIPRAPAMIDCQTAARISAGCDLPTALSRGLSERPADFDHGPDGLALAVHRVELALAVDLVAVVRRAADLGDREDGRRATSALRHPRLRVHIGDLPRIGEPVLVRREDLLELVHVVRGLGVRVPVEDALAVVGEPEAPVRGERVQRPLQLGESSAGAGRGHVNLVTDQPAAERLAGGGLPVAVVPLKDGVHPVLLDQVQVGAAGQHFVGVQPRALVKVDISLRDHRLVPNADRKERRARREPMREPRVVVRAAVHRHKCRSPCRARGGGGSRRRRRGDHQEQGDARRSSGDQGSASDQVAILALGVLLDQRDRLFAITNA